MQIVGRDIHPRHQQIAAAEEGIEDDAQGDGWRADDDFVASVPKAEREQDFDAVANLGGSLVHLPVGGNYGLAGHWLWGFLLVTLEQVGWIDG